MPAAYFDVDGTLVGTNLLHPTLMYLANQASPIDGALRLGRLALQAPLLAAAELRDRRLFNERLFYHFRGMSEDRLACLSDQVFDSMILPRVFPGARDLVDRCVQAGFRVVLVTGALDFTVRPLARHLGLEHYITNRLEMKDGYATGRLLRPVVAGPTKARVVADDARSHGDDLALCQAWSDSHSDVPMLSVVGHPVCVNPDAKLRRLARAYDWAVLELSSGGGRRRPFGFFS